MTVRALLVGLCLCLGAAGGAQGQPLYQNEAVTLTDTSLVDDSVHVYAPSRTRLQIRDEDQATTLQFRFRLHHRDGSHDGPERRLRLAPTSDTVLTPVYEVGGAETGANSASTGIVWQQTRDSVRVTVRVDLGPVLHGFRTQGHYELGSGPVIAADAFSGVSIQPVSSSPSWTSPGGERLTDPDGDGVYHTTLTVPLRPNAAARPAERMSGADSTAQSSYPSYRSEQRIVDALYHVSTDEGRRAASKADDDIWAVSHRTLLSTAIVDPEGAQARLRGLVRKGRLPQTGRSGASTMTWALAAWEVYKATADTSWLQYSYDVLRRTANTESAFPFDGEAGLFYDGTGRWKTGPAWMGPDDRVRVQSLRTNVVQYRTHRILTQMAEALGAFPDQWARVAHRVKQGVNEHLWQPGTKQYAAYRYGRMYPAPVQQTDAFGQALVVLSGITDAARARHVVQNQPVLDRGVPRLWPLTDSSDAPRMGTGPGAYWAWASAAAQNTPGVEHGLASLYRAAALNSPQANSDSGQRDRAMDWGGAGVRATVYRVLFGMRLTGDGLRLDPFVPRAYSGTHTLSGVPYRDATLDLTMKGHGTRIVQVTLDGRPLDNPVLPTDLTGTHSVQLLLSGGVPDGTIHRVSSGVVPATPVVERTADSLAWASVRSASAYRVYRNGAVVDTTRRTRYPVAVDSVLAEYQVQAVGSSGRASFRSAPVRIVAEDAVPIVEPRSRGDRTDTVSVSVDTRGTYALEAHYTLTPEGTSGLSTRRVSVNGTRQGTILLPTADDGYSTVLRMSLAPGTNTMVFTAGTGRRSSVRLDHVRLTPVATEQQPPTP